jgi:hypothetical protein
LQRYTVPKGGTKTERQSVQKLHVSARASSEPPNFNEIAEDDDFTVITSKKKQPKSKSNLKPTITDAAINTALPSSPAPESRDSGKSEHNMNHFLTAPREKIPPIVIHHHFEGDITSLNKDFHAKFQPLGFTAYRIKSGTACQTSTYKDYLNLQSFLKDNKIPFNLIRTNNSKPYRVVIKGIPQPPLQKPSRRNYMHLGWQFKMSPQ